MGLTSASSEILVAQLLSTMNIFEEFSANVGQKSGRGLLTAERPAPTMDRSAPGRESNIR